MRTGWICPKCGRVYSGYMMECLVCNREIEEEKPTESTETVPNESECTCTCTSNAAAPKNHKKAWEILNKTVKDKNDGGAADEEIPKNNGVRADDEKQDENIVGTLYVDGAKKEIPFELVEKCADFSEKLEAFTVKKFNKIVSFAIDGIDLDTREKFYEISKRYIEVAKKAMLLFSNKAAYDKTDGFLDRFIDYGDIILDTDAQLSKMDETLDAFDNFFQKIIDVYIDEK